jgi:Rrf2 family protein
MLITAKADYALRAVCRLAECEGRRAKAEALAREARIPRQFLENIMAELRDAGIVRTRRGAVGGYELVIAPERLDVATVLHAVGSTIAADHPDRDEAVPSIDELWRALVGTVRDVVERVTVADLVADALPGDLRRVAAVEGRRHGGRT